MTPCVGLLVQKFKSFDSKVPKQWHHVLAGFCCLAQEFKTFDPKGPKHRHPLWFCKLPASHACPRTKRFMADVKYGMCSLYYPYAVAKVRLPLGLPAGQLWLCSITMYYSFKLQLDQYPGILPIVWSCFEHVVSHSTSLQVSQHWTRWQWTSKRISRNICLSCVKCSWKLLQTTWKAGSMTPCHGNRFWKFQRALQSLQYDFWILFLGPRFQYHPMRLVHKRSTT